MSQEWEIPYQTTLILSTSVSSEGVPFKDFCDVGLSCAFVSHITILAQVDIFVPDDILTLRQEVFSDLMNCNSVHMILYKNADVPFEAVQPTVFLSASET